MPAPCTAGTAPELVDCGLSKHPDCPCAHCLCCWIWLAMQNMTRSRAGRQMMGKEAQHTCSMAGKPCSDHNKGTRAQNLGVGARFLLHPCCCLLEVRHGKHPPKAAAGCLTPFLQCSTNVANGQETHTDEHCWQLLTLQGMPCYASPTTCMPALTHAAAGTCPCYGLALHAGCKTLCQHLVQGCAVERTALGSAQAKLSYHQKKLTQNIS